MQGSVEGPLILWVLFSSYSVHRAPQVLTCTAMQPALLALTCSSILSQDESLAQEILEPNASLAVSETSPTTKVSTQTTAQTKDKSKYTLLAPLHACTQRDLRG